MLPGRLSGERAARRDPLQSGPVFPTLATEDGNSSSSVRWGGSFSASAQGKRGEPGGIRTHDPRHPTGLVDCVLELVKQRLLAHVGGEGDPEALRLYLRRHARK